MAKVYNFVLSYMSKDNTFICTKRSRAFEREMGQQRRSCNALCSGHKVLLQICCTVKQNLTECFVALKA